MPTTDYLTLGGEVLAETRGGVERDYLPDPLGSVVALLDSSQARTDEVAYWPYGEERSRTGTTPTPFRFVGTLGYYRDTASRTYVRARVLGSGLARWQTADPLWPDESAYGYANDGPTTWVDPDGTKPPDWKPPWLRPSSGGPWDKYGKPAMNCLNSWAPKHKDCNKLLSKSGVDLSSVMQCTMGCETRYPENVSYNPWLPDSPNRPLDGVGPARINCNEDAWGTHGPPFGDWTRDICANVRKGMSLLCSCLQKHGGNFMKCGGLYNVITEAPGVGQKSNCFWSCMSSIGYKRHQ